jgi:hypothetical protein
MPSEDEEKLKEIQESNAEVRKVFRNWTERSRWVNAHGGHVTRAGSRFSGKEGYLPLDVWDSTPDPE